MSRFKSFALFTVIFFTVGLIFVHDVAAGDKVKAHATSVNTKFEKLDVGDVEGHFIAVYEAKQIWIDDDTGEKSIAISHGTIDMNAKTGEGEINGYSVRTYPNGEKWFSKYTGKPAGKGLSKGTYEYIGGTGKYEGLSGGGTWESQSMGPGISYTTAEGERMYKGQ
jgi:hypothetical protein